MNIIFQFDDPIVANSGGVERVTDTLAKEFIKRGHKVAFLCHQKIYLLKGVTTFTAPQYYIDLAQPRGCIVDMVKRIVKEYNPEFIITQNPNKKQLEIAEFFPTRIKKISVCHTQPYSFDAIDRKQISEIKPINGRHKLFLTIGKIFPVLYKTYFSILTNIEYKRIFRLSDKCCFISSKFYDRVLKHVNVPREKLAAIPNPNTFTVDKEEYKKEKLILWVGRVENNGKNAIGFIKMWQEFSVHNPKWKAMVIGDGSDLEIDKAYVLEHNIHNLSFMGKISNVQDYYRKARFVVVTSWSESWSMVITEGMSYGCIPCAYNTYETLNEIVEDNTTGLIIQDISPRLMAEKLSLVANDLDCLNKMSKAAKIKVEQFSVGQVADQWEKLLSSIVKP